MQNLGRFGETNLNKVIFFCLFGMFLSVSTGGCADELAAAEKQLVPCRVCLEFDRDGAIGPLQLRLASRKIHLRLQHSTYLTG